MDIIDKANNPVIRRAKLSPEKQALLDQRLRSKSASPAPVNTIPARDVNEVIPLSFTQESVWLQSQLTPDGVVYNLPAAIQLDGLLNVEALEWSVNEIVKRHDILRTNFDQSSAGAQQIIKPMTAFKLPVIDLQHHSEIDLPIQIQKLIQQDAEFPFDLSKDFLLRVSLIRVKIKRHIILFTTHHIISDGWSRLVFIRELIHFYQLFLKQPVPSLAPLAIQYADYSVWQRKQFSQGAFDWQLDYWHKQLSDAAFILNLPTDYPRSSLRSFNGTRQRFFVPIELTQSLKQLSQQQATTLFTCLLSVFQVLLYRYSGQNDFLLGSPIANRQRGETEGLIGFFANTLVLRAKFSEEICFDELLQQTKQTTLAAYAHQDIPFEKLVELLQPVRSPSYSPLFQVMFAQQGPSVEETNVPGLNLSLLTEDSDAAKFDLSLSIGEYQQGLAGKLEYNSDLFQAETIDRLIEHFKVLLAAVVKDPKQKVAHLPLLSTLDYKIILDNWQNFSSQHSDRRCIYEIFEEQAKLQPNAIAIICKGQELTYADLNAKANQLAHYLKNLGVNANELVGVCIDRSLEMLIGILAIWKSGAAYLPLDSRYPTERLQYLIEDSKIRFLLTQKNFTLNLNSENIQLLVIAEIIAREGINTKENLNYYQSPENLAYAIYTSGSTGKPKGVLVEHRQLRSFMDAMDEHIQHPTSMWLAQTSISFDISILELFWPLIRGHQVVLTTSQLVPVQSSLLHVDKPMDFSLFYFASGEGQSGNKYKLLLEGARFADQNGFTAVWTPERHFATFGGLYPNPAITSAAIAAITERISIRAGSCVLPLHNPIQVAEDWALVDNLSNGRIAVSFASGWQPNDFVLAPNNYAERNQIMFENIQKVKALWRGESVNFINGIGQEVAISTLPRPIQSELPMWLTASGNPETFRQAGAQGLNLLTHLLGQSIQELAEKIQLYRKAWVESGHEGRGKVTLMLHTFIDEDAEHVLKQVKQPLKNYLRDSIGLLKPFADALGQDLQKASAEDMEAILDHAFSRYYASSGLFGTENSCLELVDQIKGIGVDEIACLIDFGIEETAVLNSLQYLKKLQQASQPKSKEDATTNLIDEIPALLEEYPISHFQCTPSLATLLMTHDQATNPWKKLQFFLVGGETLSLGLLEKMSAKISGQILNMYGPTETTIWSTAAVNCANKQAITIGKPLRNTKIIILDTNLQPVPIGIPGEIFIGGEAVVRGYLNRDDLTSQRFLHLEILPGRKEYVYRTGDRGRFLNDASIEHLGRVDYQIKMRGYRIELGEIEHVIGEYPQIQATAVILQNPNEEHSRLLAYLVWKNNTEQPIAELREFLQQKLPDYMLPAVFITLAALPLTPNGKIDRNALPLPQQDASVSFVDYVEPRTDLERQIVAIWTATMNKERIGVDDNFFELGGHSLLAADLANKIQRATGRRLPLNRFFEHPTIAKIAAYLQNNAEQSPDEIALPTIVADEENRNRPFPLTDVQQAYLIGRSAAFELGNIATHGYIELDFENFNHSLFTETWNTLISRHEMLRMIITEGSMQQILASVPYYDVSLTDISAQPENLVDDYLLSLRKEMSHQVLPAEQWPLFDLRVTKFSQSTYRLHISIDTLIADGWSSDILFREFFTLYTRAANEVLPEIAVSFRDYVIAERAIKASNLYHRSREYWQKRISSLPFGPKLPLAKDPSQIPKPTFTRRHHILSQNQWSAIKRKAQQAGITPSVFLLTAYAKILAYWCKEVNFCLNLTLFHRLPLHPQVNQIVGDFTSLTLLEINLSASNSFATDALAIQQQLWSDLEHKFFSGIEVLREIARENNNQKIATMPVVFTSTLDTDNTADNQAANTLQHLGKEAYVITQTPQVWLDHQVIERDGQLHLTWDAVEELFPESLLDEMFASYGHLLERLAGDESYWAAPQIDLLPQNQLLQRNIINATAADKPAQLLHELFTHQAQRSPNNLAVVAGSIRLNYQELYKIALGYAHQLRKLDCQPNQLIAVVMEKGWEQIAAVLAICMAGSAYLPIDASFPEERILHLLDQADVKIVLTQEMYQNNSFWPKNLSVLSVKKKVADTNLADLKSRQQLTDLAYVLFTSGSTGVPKGVMIDHQGAVNTIVDINQRFSVTAVDKVLGLSSLSFDLSVYDIFGMLAVGGCIVLPDSDLVKDPAHWLTLINQEQISIWDTVPTFLQMLVDHLENTSVELPVSLRVALISGDSIPINLPQRVKNYLPELKLISLGGATEASIWSIIYPIDSNNLPEKVIPYGKPLVNQTMHVLRADLSPCPVWVAGDIYIGGIGLAKGYWKDAEKTARSFVINPHTNERLYKTGDMGRYLPDGNIEFLGREDYQVKINGYRVELGEIESILLQHKAIEKAVVIATAKEKLQAKRLIAYVVPSAAFLARYDQASLNAKAAFQLSQPGIRQFNNPVIIDLPQLEATKPLIIQHWMNEVASSNPQTMISLAKFGEFLSCLRQITHPNMPLPKYFYPSSSSLYPLQVYLMIGPNSIEGLAAGLYYYYPVSHRLVLMENNPKCAQDKGFTLFITADLKAVQPIYPNFAEVLCWTEAGYLAQLLQASAHAQEINFTPIDFPQADSLSNLFQLSSEHIFIQAFKGMTPISSLETRNFSDRAEKTALKMVDSIQLEVQEFFPSIQRNDVQRQSYRQFDQKNMNFELLAVLLDHVHELLSKSLLTQFLLLKQRQAEMKIFLYIHPDRIQGFSKGGVFVYDPLTHQLNPYSSSHPFTINIHSGTNQTVFKRGSFSLYVLMEGIKASQTDLMLAGAVGQVIMDCCSQILLGVCPIGSVDMKKLSNALDLDSNHVYLHGFIGGRISQQQAEHLQEFEDLAKSMDPAEILENYLQEKLPSYMIPSNFVSLKQLPQSANGKIDRAALPTLTYEEEIVKLNYEPPQTEIEMKIERIWATLLELEKVSVVDNFFTIGGNSLLILQMQRKLKDLFNRDVALVDLFKHTNIRDLASFFQDQSVSDNMISVSNNRAEMRRNAAQRKPAKGTV